MFHLPSTYTVESVTSGHPDKVCDQISDAILDACLAQDPMSRVAAECFGGHGLLVIGGEITTKADIDPEAIARGVYRDIGYDDSELRVQSHLVRQSPDIAVGVDTGGAGDQGIMYGFATDETPERLPAALVHVHRLARELETLRKNDPAYAWLRPDGKTQVTVHEGKISDVLISTQHDPSVTQAYIRQALAPLLESLSTENGQPVFHVNPTGIFVQGGFEADTGLTGRKIMVDTYGGLAPHGGGAFSGKDATKVDRSAAYMCRFVAKQLVERGLAKQALVSVAYAIGRAEPLMVEATGENGRSFTDLVKREFDFRPAAIIEWLGLRRPIFRQTAAYGHFGKPGLTWEEV
ncbi:methionine adenosyltransferase [Patescibacteria group bacterium]|nr:methionine adenosyltransferase [Patescibacteria group bacterium]